MNHPTHNQGLGLLPFGELLREARRRLGLSQAELANRVKSQIDASATARNWTQTTISAWETERSAPTLDPAEITLLADVLGIAESDIEASVQTSRMPVKHLGPTSTYLQDVARFAEDSKGQFDVWILGPGLDLPVLNSTPVRAIWLNNMCAGAKYHIVLFLGSTPTDVLSGLLEVLQSIYSAAPHLRDTVTVYPFEPLPECVTAETARRLYTRIREWAASSRFARCLEPRKLTASLAKGLGISEIGTAVLYETRATCNVPSCASLSFWCFHPSLQQESLDFAWLASRQRNRLRVYAAETRQLFEEPKHD